MKDEKLLDMIRESAEEIPIPESLQPQKINEKLQQARGKAEGEKPPEGEEKKRKIRRRGNWYLPAAAVAAMAAVCMLVVGIAGDYGSGSDSVLNTAEAALETAEAEEETSAEESAAGSTQDSSTASGVTGVDAYLTAAADYEEVYEKLRENYQEIEDAAIPHESWNLESAEESETAEESAGSSSDGAASDTHEAVEDASDTALMGGEVSQTNVQVEGVDEGDIVKTDGKYIFVMDPDNGVEIVRAEDLARMSTISWETPGTQAYDMYLDGERLAVVAGVSESTLQTPSSSTQWLYEEDVDARLESRDYLEILVYDISDRESPALKGSVELDGSYLTSRKNGDYLYLMSRYDPDLSAEEEERDGYVPLAGGELLPSDRIYLPKEESSVGYTYFVVVSVDLQEPEKLADRCAVVTESTDFYVSRENIYVTGVHYGTSQMTNIVRFSYADGQIEPEAGGSVPGVLNDSFSMDEYQGYLRMVTWEWNEGGSSTGLYILDQDLQVTGQITDLAPGEDLKSSRFLGDTGYFVTFLETDPLFSVDLSDPEEPRILGELKIPGFSSYLHFYGEDRLLGIGWEDNASDGRREVKLSMFDVSDPADVQETDKNILENAVYCPGTDQYKSILVLEEQNLLGMAYRTQAPYGSGGARPFEANGTEESATSGYSPSWSASSNNGEYPEPEDYYTLFRYVEGEGFQIVFRCLLNQEEGYGKYDSYEELDSVRGITIGDMLYIVMSRGISAFHLGDTVEKTGSVVW